MPSRRAGRQVDHDSIGRQLVGERSRRAVRAAPTTSSEGRWSAAERAAEKRLVVVGKQHRCVPRVHPMNRKLALWPCLRNASAQGRNSRRRPRSRRGTQGRGHGPVGDSLCGTRHLSRTSWATTTWTGAMSRLRSRRRSDGRLSRRGFCRRSRTRRRIARWSHGRAGGALSVSCQAAHHRWHSERLRALQQQVHGQAGRCPRRSRNSPDSTSGNVHGMVLAAALACRRPVSPGRLGLPAIGPDVSRSLDDGERDRVARREGFQP